MQDAFGFRSAGNAADAVVETDVTPGEDTVQTDNTDTSAAIVDTQIQADATGDTTVTDTSTETDRVIDTAPPVKETVYVDPFAELGSTERSIFDSIKNKDYAALKGILDVITADYDSMGDIDLIRKHLKETKPRWNDEMIEAEMTRKYGLGFDESELNPQDALIYKMDLLDASDAARGYFKGKQGEVKFPEHTQPAAAEVKTDPQMTPEQAAEFKRYWEGHIETSTKDLTGEVYKFEVGRDGNKEIFDFPIQITDTDKQGLKTLLSDFDINKDFQTRYVKDDVVDLKKFMADRFKADNFDRLLQAAFAQGHAKGKLGQIKGDKNIDASTTNATSSTHDQVSARTNAALSFFGNGRK